MLKILEKLFRVDRDKYGDEHIFSTDYTEVLKARIKENKMWYAGNSSDLLEFYTDFIVKARFRNYFYNRNKSKYFWALSVSECNIKRVHSAMPRLIVDKLSEVVGSPKIDADKGYFKRLEEILSKNDYIYKLNQRDRPLTLVEGWGGYKIVINEKYDFPLIEYYEASNCRFIYDKGILSKAIFIDHYSKDDKQFVLFEIRELKENGLHIEYKPYEININNKNELKDCNFSDLGLKKEDYKPEDYDGFFELLAVHHRYYYDAQNGENYGRSIFDGKLDLFDELDETLSIASRTSRLSTPIEYVDSELLERDKDGRPIPPVRWDREYVLKNGLVNSDGGINPQQGIFTTQAKLNFVEYQDRINNLKCEICDGLIAPASLGIEMSRKDNASAAREKEKTTFVTRSNLIEQETRMLKKLFSCVLIADDRINGKEINNDNYKDISINYKEFSTPVFEDIIHSLAEGFNYGMLSPEEVVERLYRDSKGTKEHNDREIAYIKEQLDRKNAMFSNVEMKEDSPDDNSAQKEDNPDKLLQSSRQ